jgi:hypothetical protein
VRGRAWHRARRRGALREAVARALAENDAHPSAPSIGTKDAAARLRRLPAPALFHGIDIRLQADPVRARGR